MKYLLIALMIGITAYLWFKPDMSDGKDHELAEGIQFRHISEGEWKFEEGPMWQLSYRSEYPLKHGANRSEVIAEVLQIWEHYFRDQVEAGGYLFAKVQARERREGFGLILKRPVRNFIFKMDHQTQKWAFFYGVMDDGEIVQEMMWLPAKK